MEWISRFGLSVGLCLPWLVINTLLILHCLNHLYPGGYATWYDAVLNLIVITANAYDLKLKTMRRKFFNIRTGNECGTVARHARDS